MSSNATNHQDFEASADAFEQKQTERRQRNIVTVLAQLPAKIEEDGDARIWIEYNDDGETCEATGSVFEIGEDGVLHCDFDTETNVEVEDIIDIELT